MQSLLFLGTPKAIWAQEYSYIHYTTKDGLAGETVHGLAQDKEGFIWAATETGLSRFDGKYFRNFTVQDGLPSNEIISFYQDAGGRLWIVPFKNELCYFEKGKIHNTRNDTLLRKLQFGGLVAGVGEINIDTLLIWDVTGRVNYIVDNKVLFSGFATKDHPLLPVLYNWPAREKSFTFPPSLLKEILPHTRYTGLTEAKISRKNNCSVFYSRDFGGCLVISNRSGKILYEASRKGLEMAKMHDDSTVWLASNFGVELFNFVSKKTVISFLPGSPVEDVLEDLEGNVWFSTRGNGIFKLSVPLMVHYTLGKNQFSLPVQWIEKKGSQLYISDDHGGLYKLIAQAAVIPEFPSLEIRKVNTHLGWLKEIQKDLFVPYASSDFFNIERVGGRTGIKSLQVFNDTILAAANNDARLFSLHNGRELQLLHKGRATCAFRFEHQYFVGTLNGLFIYDLQGRQTGHYLNGRISYFVKAKNTLWIGTYDNGVYRYQNGKLTDAINMRNTGISSNICRCLFWSNDYLWIGTDKGIDKVAVAGDTYRVDGKFGASDGLSTGIINSIYADSLLVYVGTPKGLDCFYNHPLRPTAFCSIRMTDIIVSHTTIPQDSIIVLKHNDNNIKFRFSGLSFSSGGQMQYQYRLLGLENAWQTTTGQFLSYPSLPSGTYILQLRAINKFGQASPFLLQRFVIRKAIYEQWWFRIGLLSFLLLTLSSIIHFRIRKLKNREDALRQLNQRMMEMEHTALRTQMNPHFIFNCLNAIQNYIVRHDAEGANFYLSQFSTLVRKTLDLAPRLYISLREEISYISSYLELEKMQSGSSFTYTIEVAPNINSIDLQIPNMVAQPYIENAVKHGFARMREGGILSIVYHLHKDGLLECSITDNGVGIDFATNRPDKKNHTPKGMAITKERVEMLNKMADKGKSISISIQDRSIYHERGTQVLIHFPLLRTKT